MNLRFLFFSTLLSAAFCAAPCAQAQTRVGEAVVIQNEVVRVAATATPISVGDSMLRDEIVRTGADSAARFVMADSTNLSLGPSATLKLDRTVFNDEHSYRDVAIRMTTGAFRFVTGHSEKTAYKITTPLATIGVRGTTLEHPLATRPLYCRATGRRSPRLHAELPMRAAHPARRHRNHHLDRRQGRHRQKQYAALDLCRDLRRKRRAVLDQSIRGRLAGHHARRP
ncbi:hypothetical protein ACVWXO_010980 [Bradyrhizobium sp. LM2.7]